MLKLLLVLSLVNAGTGPTFRREIELFNWLTIPILRYSVALLSIGEGLRIYGGLFHSSSRKLYVNLFISIIGAIVLLLTAFFLGSLLLFIASSALSIDTDSFVLLLVPVAKYSNVDLQKKQIMKENKGP